MYAHLGAVPPGGRVVMWRAAGRHLTRHDQQFDFGKKLKVRVQQPGAWSIRPNSSVAAVVQAKSFANSELGGLDLHGSSALSLGSSASPCRRTNPLEESVTALDAALHSAVQLPWLANHLWWTQWLSDSRRGRIDNSNKAFRNVTRSAFQSPLGATKFVSAAAVELDEEELLNEEQKVVEAQIKRFQRGKSRAQEPAKLAKELPNKEKDVVQGPKKKLQRARSRVVQEYAKLVAELPNEKDVVEAQKQKPQLVKTPAQEHAKLVARQMKIETEAWERAVIEYRKLLSVMCKKNLAPNLPFVQSLALGWFEPFTKAIEAEQKAVEALEFKEHRAGYGPYIAQLPADMLAVITMHKLLGMLMHDVTNSVGCVKVITAASQIGEAVEMEVGIHKFLQKGKQKKRKDKNVEDGKVTMQKSTETPTGAAQNATDGAGKLHGKVKKLLKKQYLRVAKNLVRNANGDEPWSPEVRVKVGSILIQLLLDSAFVQSPASQTEEYSGELRPAFKHTMRTFTFVGGKHGSRKFGVVECDPIIQQQLSKSISQVRLVVMPYMPMLVKPRDWTRFNKGAYLVLPSSIMRTHGNYQQKEAIEKCSPTRMQKVFDALNTLGSIRWRINTSILDVVERIWADGGRVGEMVDAENVPVPEKPETDDELVLKTWRREAAIARRINRERHSLRCDTELKLTVARKLRNEKGFYYPHNLDFRGRAYPLHPHLNHLGSDMCRGVLEFELGCPLGEHGFRWLKIHLATVFAAGGVDKLSFDGRAAFVDENLDEVFDSAEKPLEGRRWWLKAEDPFQCLAACMNLRDALLSEDVETFVSHLPIHQDGSCNGLQHYAALGRDQVGAESVNLIAGERPADVYTGIAVRVRAIMEKDAAGDDASNPNVGKAKLLLDQIDRKLVKQTVMTSVYGVTFIGARNQIMERLQERALGDDVTIFKAACYAAKITIEALGEMFKEAKCIMTWLGDCAKIIASEGETVRWTTPMGLPVVQPYRKPGRKMVKTALQCLALRENGNQPVAVQRQRSAFPPNFVHSLDGSHMMMTALSCRKEDLYFAGVHDSFWTHAGTVDKMNSILRRTFVELYSEPILENLLEGFRKQFPNLDFPDVPRRGNLDLAEVCKAPYFFN